MRKKIMISIFAAVTLAAPAAVSANPLAGLFGPRITGEELDKAIEQAAQHPLGSEQNPVRAHLPTGQRAYLRQLQCENGKTPSFRRIGSAGVGVFGNIVDIYDVQCRKSSPEKSEIWMDMYHPDHEESAAVPGFTMPGEPSEAI